MHLDVVKVPGGILTPIAGKQEPEPEIIVCKEISRINVKVYPGKEPKALLIDEWCANWLIPSGNTWNSMNSSPDQ